MICLFCNCEELERIQIDGNTKSYKSHNDEFICSACVHVLSNAQQDDLKRALFKAREKGFINKAEAIKSFLIEDKEYVRETKESKRNMARKRTVRTSRSSRN